MPRKIDILVGGSEEIRRLNALIATLAAENAQLRSDIRELNEDLTKATKMVVEARRSDSLATNRQGPGLAAAAATTGPKMPKAGHGPFLSQEGGSVASPAGSHAHLGADKVERSRVFRRQKGWRSPTILSF